jgi:hypothetical protein
LRDGVGESQVPGVDRSLDGKIAAGSFGSTAASHPAEFDAGKPSANLMMPNPADWRSAALSVVSASRSEVDDALEISE